MAHAKSAYLHPAKKTGANIASAQQLYKQNYGRKVRVATTFQLGNWAFIDRRPLAEMPDTNATRTEQSDYNTMMPRSPENFGIMTVRPKTFAIGEHRMNSVFTAGRATRAPIPERLDPIHDHRIHQQDEKNHKAFQQLAKRKLDTAKAKETIHGSVTQKRIVDETDRHIWAGNIIQYVVR